MEEMLCSEGECAVLGNTDIWGITKKLKASFRGLFKTNFCGRFRKLFLFTKFNFSKFRENKKYAYDKSDCIH